LGFLAWTVFVGHTPVLFVGGFLVFLAFTHAAAPYQSPLNLRPALLVGFFLSGLVVHGALQQWWIEPVLSRLPAAPLFAASIVLTAFNDNAAITYLASLVPTFTPELRYAVVAGAVTGGGLTVIANAPNPAGQAILGRYFTGGISPLGLLAGAAVPTLVMSVCFFFLRLGVARPSADELDRALFVVVHHSDDLDRLRGFQLGEHGAAFADVGHRQLDVLARHRVHERIVLGRALARILGGLHRGTDLGEEPREIAELRVVDRALDRAARGVAHHQHDFRAGELAGELHASENVV